MQGSSIIKTISESDLNVTSLNINDITRNLTKDTTTPFTIRGSVKGDDVTNLGKKIELQLVNLDVRRSTSISIPTSTTSTITNLGKEYQIASNIPTITLPNQVDKNTTIEFTNTSSYDVELIKVKFNMTRNLNNGSYVLW